MLKTFHHKVFKTPDKFRIISVTNKTTRNQQGFFEASIQLLTRGTGGFTLNGERGEAGGSDKEMPDEEVCSPSLVHRHANMYPDGSPTPGVTVDSGTGHHVS